MARNSTFPLILLVAMAAIAIDFFWFAPDNDSRENAITASDTGTTAIMAFPAGFDPNDTPLGWFHRTFWFIPAMKLSRETKDNVDALRCETDKGASIYGRYTDIAVHESPVLAWSWLVEKPIAGSADETSENGDDHPVRLYLTFVDEEDNAHSMEIIWSNGAFKPGEVKYIGDFAHYVAHSGTADVGKWVPESIDLLDLYRKTMKRDDRPRLKELAVFCDSDNTKTSSIAYVGPVTLSRAGN